MEGGGGARSKMEDLLHMLAISYEITLQHCNKSTQVNCNLRANKSSKMSKNLQPYPSVTYLIQF